MESDERYNVWNERGYWMDASGFRRPDLQPESQNRKVLRFMAEQVDFIRGVLHVDHGQALALLDSAFQPEVK